MVVTVIEIGFTWRKKKEKDDAKGLMGIFDKQRRRESCAVCRVNMMGVYRECIMSSFTKILEQNRIFISSEKFPPLLGRDQKGPGR